MKFHLFRHQREFRLALSSTCRSYYAIFESDKLAPNDLLSIDNLAETNQHISIETDVNSKAEVLGLIRSFFEQAAKLDNKWHYSFTSKIPLAITNYHDIQLIFHLILILQSKPDISVFILVKRRVIYKFLQRVLNIESITQAPWLLPGPASLLRFSRTLFRTLINQVKLPGKPEILVFTLTPRTPLLAIDPYFTDLPAILNKKTTLVTVYLSAGGNIRLFSDNNFYPLEAFISFFDVISAFIFSLFPFRENIKKSNFTNKYFAHIYHLLCCQERKNGEYFMHFLYQRAFSKMLKNARPKTVIYPFENRNWEKHLLEAAKPRKIQCIGYQHSSITPRHLAFESSGCNDCRENLPDKIITVGEITAGKLKENFPLIADNVNSGASMRRIQDHLEPPDKHGVLLAISSSRNEAWRLIKFLLNASKNIQIPVIIRSHPTIPIKDIFHLYNWPENIQLSQEAFLKDDLKKVSMVVYSSSTVAIEGMLFKRLPIYIDIGDIPSGDPIPGNFNFKSIVGNAIELADCVTRIINTDTNIMRNLSDEAVIYAEKYLMRADTTALNRIQNIILDEV